MRNGTPVDLYRAEPDPKMRRLSSVLTIATRSDPPHLVDVEIANDQQVGIWYTIEPYNEMSETKLQGWDIKFKRFITVDWSKVTDMRINSRNYEHVSMNEWELRIRDTNIRYDEDKKIRQSKARFGKGRRR